jgi:acyl carrier protein
MYGMGLDLVELVMEAEAEFDVRLDHDVVPLTPGELLDATLAKLRKSHGDRFEADLNYPEKVWMQLKEMIVTQLGVEANDVTMSANFVTDLGCA